MDTDNIKKMADNWITANHTYATGRLDIDLVPFARTVAEAVLQDVAKLLERDAYRERDNADYDTAANLFWHASYFFRQAKEQKAEIIKESLNEHRGTPQI